MALRGDLASVDLAQVFQMLALNQKVGLLYIQSPTAWKALYFNDNGATLYFNEHTMLDRVLAKLIRGGQIPAEGVLEARESAALQGHQVVDTLLSGGYLTEEDLDSCVRTEIEEEIYELFFWDDAKFEFYEGATEYEGREGVIHDQFFFGTDALIMEAARRIDEWGHVTSLVPSGMEVYKPAAADSRAFDLPDDLFQIFELMDGMRNVDRIIEITGQPNFHVYKMICSLLEDNVIEPIDPPSLLTTGRDCLIEGRTQDAINLFERAVELGVGLPGVHSQAAEAYTAFGEYELSGYHNKCIAEHHAANGNLRKATALFRQVLEAIPTDLQACQRIVELSIDHPELATDDFDPLNVGKDLVDLFLEMGEIDRVRTLLEELIREHPSDIELKKSLINVHTKVGDTKRVIELYESIAEDLTRGGDPIQAIKYLQKILQLNRARTDISEWIKRLYQVDERRRSRRRSMVALGMVFCLLVCASIGYYFYTQAARTQFATLGLATLKQKRDFSGAAILLDEFIAKYPLTPAVGDAKKELAEIDVLRRAADAEKARKVGLVEKKYEEIRAQYKEAWTLHLQHWKDKELEKALTAIEQVRTKVAKAGQPKDQQWSERNAVEKNYRQVLTYLTTAQSLVKKARAAQDRGDWQKQRKFVLELITEYEWADVAKRAEIPVQFVTSPPGAKVYHDGKPLEREVNGKLQPVLTPAIVQCPNRTKVQYSVHKAGFEVYLSKVTPREDPRVEALLAKLPMTSLKFDVPAVGTPSISPNGKVVIALRGGLLGVSSDGAKPSLSRKLSGLTEIDGVPFATAAHIYFRTNEGHVVCHRLSDGRFDWDVKQRTPLRFDPVVANNRMFLVDRDGRMTCYSVGKRRRELWKKTLPGVSSGPPFVLRRNVSIGAGRWIFVLDTLKGEEVIRLQTESDVSTRVYLTASHLLFGTADGKLHGYRRGQEKPLWTVDVGRAIRDDEIAAAPDHESFFVLAADDVVKRVSLTDGRVMVERKMDHRVRRGMLATEDMLFVVTHVVERQKDQSVRQWDVLLALDPKTFEPQWQFSDGADFLGRLASGSKRLYLTGSKGEVHRIR